MIPRHPELRGTAIYRVPKESTPFYRLSPNFYMFYDLDTNTNSSSNELKVICRTLLLVIMLQQSDKGFDSGKKHVMDICSKSYSNGLDAI